MSRAALLLGLLGLLAACTGPLPPQAESGPPAGRSDTKQQPSNYDPGLHLSGHADVGIVKRF